MYSKKVKLMKSGLVNNSLALHNQLLSDGYTVEDSKKIIKEMHLDFLKTFCENVEDKEINNALEKARQTLLSKYKESSTPERDRVKLKRFIESYDEIKHLL